MEEFTDLEKLELGIASLKSSMEILGNLAISFDSTICTDSISIHLTEDTFKQLFNTYESDRNSSTDYVFHTAYLLGVKISCITYEPKSPPVPKNEPKPLQEDYCI